MRVLLGVVLAVLAVACSSNKKKWERFDDLPQPEPRWADERPSKKKKKKKKRRKSERRPPLSNSYRARTRSGFSCFRDYQLGYAPCFPNRQTCDAQRRWYTRMTQSRSPGWPEPDECYSRPSAACYLAETVLDGDQLSMCHATPSSCIKERAQVLQDTTDTRVLSECLRYE